MPTAAPTHDPEKHLFRFDLDKAIATQLLEAIEGSDFHALTDAAIPAAQGVYAIYEQGKPEPIYVGKTGVSREGTGTTIRRRLSEHSRTIKAAPALAQRTWVCRYLVIPEQWRIMQAEHVLIKKYAPLWNGTGFGNHVPGSGRPGKIKSRWERFLDGELQIGNP